ncbi:MAG TPA: ABC-F family ATP-binding cassette domain-containing protein [Trebonia sp.]|jgi:ATP-binding cassette subfamily F protein uup|nr:ABC-F family ATP-binding cassette domain-containing protein [Trebonia sp.]
MANLISLEKVAKAYGPRPLLDGVSLGVGEGDRIGVVGRNGAGKSTLLAILAGLAEPDSGRAARASGLRIGYLRQADAFTGTVGENVFGDLVAGGAWERDPRARSVAAELLPGFDLDADVAPMSGGERRRIALAALLVAEQDVLLLDEPTNHLDIEAIDWLARYLRDRGTTLVVVSHDRWLLDTACDQMWEVDDGQVYAHEGGYSAYVLAQAERQRTAEGDETRRRNLARKELAWLRRGPQARGTKPKFRVDAANALIAAEPPARETAELTKMATARLGKTVLELEDVSLSIAGRTLLGDVTWRIGPGDRIGIVGVNGAGKTSLLRLLGDEADAAELKVTGHVVRGKTIRVGHLSQELLELDPGKRVRESAEEVQMRIMVGKRELSAGQLLERLGFVGDRQWTPVGDLSGGERRRLQMLRLLMNEPNVLLLDEPTNDLDIDMLTELEDILDGWPGTLVVVSHDRYFLERACDHIVALLGDGTIAFLGGGVDEYLQRSRARRAALAAQAASARASARAGSAEAAAPLPAPASGTAGAAEAARPALSAAEERLVKKELARLERQIDKLSEREEKLHADLAANASDYVKLTALGDQLRSVQDEKSALEERWLEAAADLG